MVTEVKDQADLRRAWCCARPARSASTWLRRFGERSTAFASGWMQLRGARRRGGYDRGFVLSDHADWPGLLGRDRRHRRAARHRHARQRAGDGALPAASRGCEAEAFDTEYGDDVVEADAAAQERPLRSRRPRPVKRFARRLRSEA